NPQLAAASASAPVTVVADPADCAFQFDPVGKKSFASSCDIAKGALANAGVGYLNQAAPAGSVAVVRIGGLALSGFDGRALPAAELKAHKLAWTKTLGADLKAAGYPAKADPEKMNKPLVVALLW